MLELFVNPLLLGGLAFASAPVIIHLLNRRRYLVHDWAAMDFLLEAQISNRRRLRFEDILLLLLRMAVIIALVMAVCRPIVRGLAGWREDARVVVLDDSFSMAVASAPDTVFGTARQGAVDQVQDAIGGGIPVSVWLGSRPGADPRRIEGAIRGGVVAEARDDETSPEVLAALAGKDLLDSLREATPGDLSLRFADVVRAVAEESRQDETPQVRSIVLISDFRAVDWISGDGSLVGSLDAAFEEISRYELDERLRFQFVDVGLASTPNVAVTECRVVDSPVLAGVPVRIAVEVTNFGTEIAPRLEGTLEIGKPLGAVFDPVQRIPLPLFVDVAPGESARVEVQHAFESGGQFPLRVRIEGDALSRDDESYGVAVVRDKLRVVIVDGAPAVDRFARESGYIVTALAPRGEVPSGVEASVVDGEITAQALLDADVAMILNRARISEGERDVLEAFSRQGGGIAWFVGANVDTAAYREISEFASQEERAVLFPAVLQEPGDASDDAANRAEPVSIRFGDWDHPTLSLFRGLENPSLEAVLFSRYFRLAPLPGASVIAHFGDDEATPAIIESGLAPAADGEEPGGRIVVFNTTADRDWSDWPTDPSYPILLQEWARHLARRRGSGREMTMGEALVVRTQPGVEYRLEDMLGGEVEPHEAGDPDGIAFAPHRAGLYRLVSKARAGVVVESDGRGATGGMMDAAGNTIEWFAWRRAKEESELEALTAARLERIIAPTGIDFAIGDSIEVDAFRNEQEGEVWRWLALAAGLFLLTELFAAWWFGRRS